MKKITISLFLVLLTVLVSAQTKGTMTVTATTKATSSPEKSGNNIVAIYVVDANGKFVKTLLGSTSGYRSDLTNWKAACTYNCVDAVTNATFATHAARTGTWAGTNTSKVLVADGNYTVKFEVTDNSKGIEYLGSFAFAKGRTAVSLTPTATGLSNITLKWTPDFTGIENNELPTLYKIYPNPVQDEININGFGVKSLDVYSLTGKNILSSSDSRINVSQLPSGVYFLNVKTENQSFTQKFIKQ